MTENDDEIMAKIRRAAAEGRVELAPQESLEFLWDFADEFLEKILGIEGALITDLSEICHFEGERKNTRPKIIKRVLETYKVDITPVYDKPFPAMLHYIRAHSPCKK